METFRFSEIARGFFLTLFVGVVMPVGALAMIPSSGIALVFVPFWTAFIVFVFFTRALAGERLGFAIGSATSALFLIALFTVPKLAFTAACGRGYVRLQPPSISGPTNVVFDNVTHQSVRQFADSNVMLTLLVKHKVFEIERDKSGAVKGTWLYSAGDFSSCSGPDQSKIVIWPPPKSSSDTYCLVKEEADAPNADVDTITIRGSYASETAANEACHKIEVIEGSDGIEKLLGSFRLYGLDTLMPASDGIKASYHNWLNIIIRDVFGIKFDVELNKK